MQSRRLVLFLVCMAVWVGLAIWVKSQFFPDPPPKAAPLTEKQQQQIFVATLPARATLPGGDGAGVGGSLAVLTDFLITKGTYDKKPPFRYQADVDDQFGAAAGAGAALGEPKAVKPVESKTSQPSPLLTLGSQSADSEYHLGVVLDPRGAGVRSVVLNKFQQADAQGKPEWLEDAEGKPLLDDKGKKIPRPMELVQEKLYDRPTTPSNLLYHYDVDQANSDRPLDTLGKVVWKLTRVEGDTAFCDAVAQKLGSRARETKIERKPDVPQLIEYSTDIQDVRITKEFTLSKATYHLGLKLKFQRVPETPATDKKFRYQLAGAHGLRVEGLWYTSVFRQALIGMLENESSLRRQLQTLKEISIKEGGDESKADQNRRILYAAVGVQFFASALVVDDTQENKDFLASVRPTLETRCIPFVTGQEIKPSDATLKLIDPKDPGKSDDLDLTPLSAMRLASLPKGIKVGLLAQPGANNRLEVFDVLPEAQAQPMFLDDITVRVMSRPIELKDDAVVEHKFLLYNGPVKVRLLNDMTGAEAVPGEVVERYNKTLHLNTLTDYHNPGVLGTIANALFITDLLIFVTNVMHTVLGFIHQFIPIYGICIMVLTIMVRGMMFPVSRKQAMTSIKMQELGPELKKLQEKFKDDRQSYGLAQMELFRKHGINPFGSCWMLFLQMPIFMGLYYSLQESIFFRLSPFLWMENLAAPDMLFRWGDQIPWISRPEDYGWFLYLGPYLNLLPIIAVTLMIFQQKMMMPPPADEQQAMQQKMMKYMMIIFAVMFYKVAAGLCVYFIASSVWGFCERKLLPKKKTLLPDGTLAPPPSADGLLQRLLGKSAEPAPVAALDTAANAGGIKSGPSKAERRQERERRKQARDNAKDGGKSTLPENAGWLARLRHRIAEFWAEVEKQTEKQRQARNKDKK